MRLRLGWRAITRFPLLAAAVAIAGCATIRGDPDGFAKINPASLAAEAEKWDGRRVEVVGLLVWETQNLGLYQSYGAYCRGAERAAIYVDWNDWPGVSRADNRRRVMVRGIFRNRVGAKPAVQTTMPSSSAPGPGPLDQGAVVRWLSSPLVACPATR